MDFLDAVIFSLIEGLTEFLPVSSTGHLVLTAKLLNIPQTEFVKSFEVIIQLGAILAVVVLYWKKILDYKKVWRPIMLSFIPTAILGFSLYSIIKNHLLGNEMVTVWALAIGGVAMIAVEYLLDSKDFKINKIEQISNKHAVLIGLFQSISIIPGVSRAAATIIGAMLLGTNRKTAVEFSFLLAIPTMAGAVGLDLVKSNFHFTANEWGLLATGFVGSFFFAILAVKFFIKFIQNHTFMPFGIYRIILAVVFYLFVTA